MIQVTRVWQDHGMDVYPAESATLGEEDLFCLATYGQCVFRIGERKLVLGKGEALLLPAGTAFYWRSIPTVFHAKTFVSFRQGPGEACLPMLASAEPLHGKVGCFDTLQERMKRMLDQWEEHAPYRETYASALLTESLALWNREWDRGEISSETHRTVEAMKRYIQERYRERITKETLADAVGRSPNYCAALFRRVTGQTIGEFVHAQRVKVAVYMLGESELTVADIAEFLGYSDVSYFTRVFKRIAGNPPSAYGGGRSANHRKPIL
ncbi:AraC family transcriptional regulator [Paenibacillus sp. TRM 82003]|nr:AraC family transcriptional regulator [Paenibacillus sp. TRM 82003]